MVSRLYIIGGLGYVGARMCETLAADFKISLTHRSMTREQEAWAKRIGLAPAKFDSSTDSLLPSVGDVDAIINLAMPSAAEAALNPEAATKKALVTADACTEMVRSGTAERLIHFSTFHVYGASRPYFDESMEPKPIHPYGYAHLSVERALKNGTASAKTIVVRPTNLVGTPAHTALGDQARLIFLDICRQAALGRINLQNDGASYRDILSLSDAFKAIRVLLSSRTTAHTFFNLGFGRATRLNQLANLVASAAPGNVEVNYGDGIDGFREPFSVSIRRLEEIGWRPAGDISAEAARCVAFFSKKYNQ